MQIFLDGSQKREMAMLPAAFEITAKANEGLTFAHACSAIS